jgi:tetratricopeptide (TPR) repeat protein
MRDRTWTKMREARDLLQEAVKIDPDFAPAWAQLGGALMFVGERPPLSGGNAKSRNTQALAAARRAVALDPQLAEAHQMLGFALGFESPEGHAHLRHALRLDPGNPQTVYWWSNAAGMAGNAALQEKAARRALALDPLWKRPTEMVAKFAIYNGRRAEAYQLLEKLRAADPEAAVEVEMGLSHEQGDLSNVVKIGRAQGNITTVQGTAGKMTLAWSLTELGYVRESLLIGGVSPFDRLIYLRRLPDRQRILAETQELVGASEEAWVLTPLLLELARTKRHEDIVALFDRPGSGINRLQKIDESNRTFRATLGGIVGRALYAVGRDREGAKLFHASDEAVRVILANGGNLGPQAVAEVAGGEAMLGRRNRALTLLDRAVSRGWFAYDGQSYRLNEMPWFEGLRGDPRFERLVRITNARRLQERRETEVLGLI